MGRSRHLTVSTGYRVPEVTTNPQLTEDCRAREDAQGPEHRVWGVGGLGKASIHPAVLWIWLIFSSPFKNHSGRAEGIAQR